MHSTAIDPAAMFKLSYGLFVLAAREGRKDNGCIINTAVQITSSPLRLSIAVNKANFTHGMIASTGEFNVSVLAESAPFAVFQQFGFQSGRTADKFASCGQEERSGNGIRFVRDHANCVISARVCNALDYGTHTLFVADVAQSFVLSGERSATYQYYFDRIKPKPPEAGKKGFACKICGYVHEGPSLPEGFVCPLCKHGPADFQPL